MAEARKKADWTIVAATVAVILLVPMGCYIGGYFAMTTYVQRDPFDDSEAAMRLRHFRREWQCLVFYPATRVESVIRGYPVKTYLDTTEPVFP